MATGSSQCGQGPPGPMRRANVPQSGQRLLAEETLLAVGAFIDGALAAGPGGRHGELAGLVLVAAPEGGLAAPVTAVLPPPGRAEWVLADRAGDRLGVVS
jgi:hypothetical protein